MAILRILVALYAIYMFVAPIVAMKHQDKGYEYHIMSIILSIVLILFVIFGSVSTFAVIAIGILFLNICLGIIRGLLTGKFNWIPQTTIIMVTAALIGAIIVVVL